MTGSEAKRALAHAAMFLTRDDEAPSALRGKVDFLYELMTRDGREDLVQLKRNKDGRFGPDELSSFVKQARDDRNQAGRRLREATIYLLMCIVTKVTPCAERAAELSKVFERSTGQKKSHILIGFCDLEDQTTRFRTPDPASFREPCPPGEFTYFVDIFRIFSRLTESSDEFLGLHKQIFLTIAWLGRAELHQGTQDAVDLRFLMFALVDKIIAAWLEVDSNGSLREFVVGTIHQELAADTGGAWAPDAFSCPHAPVQEKAGNGPWSGAFLLESPQGSPAEGWQITHESPRDRKVEMDYDAKRAEYTGIVAAANGDAVILGHFGGREPNTGGAILSFEYGNGLTSMESL